MPDFGSFLGLLLPFVLVVVVALIGLKTLGIVRLKFIDELLAPTPFVNGRFSSESFKRISICLVLVFWFITLILAFDVLSFLKTAQRTPGEVTNKSTHVYWLGRYGWMNYVIEVRFMAVDGKIRTVKCREEILGLIGFILPNEGDDIEVLYDRKNPNEVSINQFGVLWGNAYCFGSLGFLFFLLAFLTGSKKQEDVAN